MEYKDSILPNRITRDLPMYKQYRKALDAKLGL